MSAPYDRETIARLLRQMPDWQLAETTSATFQHWPAQVVVAAAEINSLIRHERDRRQSQSPKEKRA